MLVKSAIAPPRLPSVSARFAGILSGILMLAIAATFARGPALGASPSPDPTSHAPKTQCAGVAGRSPSCPGKMKAAAVVPLEGLDVSRWQATINWPLVKAAGKKFVVMKATEGTGYVDPQYAINRAGAMGVGIDRKSTRLNSSHANIS